MEHDDLSIKEIFSAHGMANLLMGITLFTVFVSIFYFTYASHVEGEIITNQINNLVDNFTENFNVYDIKLPTKPLSPPDMSDKDESVEKNNKGLINDAIKSVGIFAAVCIFICMMLYYFYGYNLKRLLIDNFILILFVAFTEYFYITFISANFQSLDTNEVKLNIIRKIKNM
jgi:flagellar biosynthesis protein FlhB